MMKQSYSVPTVRAVDLRLDFDFCASDKFSGTLEDTYDDIIDD